MFIAIGKLYKYISSGDLRDYLAWRRECGHLQNSSVANIRMYLISFFKWLKIENYIDRNPMDRIGVVKVDKKIKYIMTEEEQELMRCACRSPRDRAIVEILSSSGIRVSELIALNRDDIDFDRNQFKVMGKGSKERWCYITPKAKIHLKWYLESRDDNDPALFVEARQPHGRLTKGGVEYIIKKIAKESGIPVKQICPHAFRRGYATGMINKGAPVEVVSKLLGHSSTATTIGHYGRINETTLKSTYDRYIS
jgi:site-specific recombinase XerD